MSQKAVAAQMVHVRIDHRDGGGGGDGRLHRIAALGESLPARLYGEAVRSGHHAPATTDALVHAEGLPKPEAAGRDLTRAPAHRSVPPNSIGGPAMVCSRCGDKVQVT